MDQLRLVPFWLCMTLQFCSTTAWCVLSTLLCIIRGFNCTCANQEAADRELIQAKLVPAATNPEAHCETSQVEEKEKAKIICCSLRGGEWVWLKINSKFLNHTLSCCATKQELWKLKGVEELTQRNRPPQQTGEIHSSLLHQFLPPESELILLWSAILLIFSPALILVQREHPVLPPEGWWGGGCVDLLRSDE